MAVTTTRRASKATKRPITRSSRRSKVPSVDLSEARKLLQGLYLELTSEIEEAQAITAAMSDPDERYVGDEGDTGLLASQRAQTNTVLASIRARRDQVTRALERVDAGTYGTCETCDEPIPSERLEAFPAVTECVDCRRTRERWG
jgi:RNA polymerase-binding transcription factor DksA